MPKFITIATFTLPSELAVVKSKLESEGILCYAKNELTVQSHNFLSNALGGIELQVKQEQAEEAIEILKLGGYHTTIEEASFTSFDKKMNNPRFRKKLKGFTFLFLLIMIVTLVGVGYTLYENTRPNPIMQLQGEWCLHHLVYDEEVYYPSTKEVKLTSYQSRCNEVMSFSSGGYLSIPGFHTASINARWIIKGEKLKLYNTDTLHQMLDGIYIYTFKGDQLVLKSPSTSILCFKL